MKNTDVIFGIDIGGTNTKIGLFNSQGQLEAFSHHPTSKDQSPEDFIQELAFECGEILKSQKGFPLDDPCLKGVGVGAPMANYLSGRVDHAPNLGWKNVELKRLLHKHFQVPIAIENDANLSALGEKEWGAGKDLSDFVLLTLGTGVGTGIISQGKLHRGKDGLGGEGGHMIIPHTKTRSCSCGGTNHLESYLCAEGIKKTILEETGMNWSPEELGVKFQEKNPSALKVIRLLSRELSSALVSMAVLLGPEAFILGGGISKLGKDFNEIVLKEFNQLIHYSLKNKIKIITAELSTDQGAIFGGAALIREELLKQETHFNA